MSSTSLPAERCSDPLLRWLAPREKLAGLSPLDQLYNRLDGLFPTRFRAQFPDTDSVENWKREWAEGFTAERVTFDEIATGIDALRGGRDPMRRDKGWPPNFTEFLAACRPPIEHEAAYHEAVREMRRRHSAAGGDRWSHPAIFRAAAAIGGDLLSSTWPGMRARWIDVLDDCLAEIRAGRMSAEIPKVDRSAMRLDAPKPRVLTAAEQQARDAELAAKLNELKDRPKPGLEWARRLVERAELNPSSVTATALRMARNALGINNHTHGEAA
ncbi:hypothetical protein [Derxia gummosa]|uniref:Uncharacterized protein n=1 Tax=Derxia gummosa DSM 723 TaxID=1121388 RepID=A0A8B6X961_9BURK|nr:hypothetical protein [Derxia gummosa]